MAKSAVSGLLTNKRQINEPADNQDLDSGRIISTGVGLREGELAALDSIAEKYAITRNALLRFAARDFILRHRNGEIDLEQFIEEPEKPRNRMRYRRK